ncbi:MAG: RNA polymerase sigma factor [Terriglobales bacterium]
MASIPLQDLGLRNELTDEQIVERVLAGDTALFEVLMRRHNQRLYRVARAILRDDTESEDVMQDAYVRAFQHLTQFEARAKFSTWLTRIAINEALARSRRRNRWQSIEPAEPNGEPMITLTSSAPDPEQRASSGETVALLEQAISKLPESYRTVLVLRDLEDMSTAATAQVLELSEENVKIRLHRARALLRKQLYARVGATSASAFQFNAVRCDRVVKNVFARLAELEPDRWSN